MWQLKAIGGTGSYKWFSFDSKIALTREQAFVESLKIGESTLRVQDDRNPNNFALIKIEVADVHHLEWLESRVEALKGETLLLNSIAIDARNRKFTNCTSLDI